MGKKKVCFFAKVKDPRVLERVEFYAQDLQILSELGFDVRITASLKELRPADFYFIWWWTWAFFPLIFAKLHAKPSLITGVFDCWCFKDRPYLHQKMMKYSLKEASANVFVSKLEYDTVCGTENVKNPYYIPLIVDTEVYSPGDTLRNNTIVTVAWMNGSNAERKCLPEIVKAAELIHKKHPKIKFLLAGEKSTYYPVLEEMVRNIGAQDYIEFPGVVTKEKKIEYMQNCSVYLQPSRFEGFGLAILEAMSCGAPIVTSPVGALPELTGDTTMLVDGKSPEEIAGAVDELLRSAELRKNLGKKARHRAESMFSFKVRKQKLQEVIYGFL